MLNNWTKCVVKVKSELLAIKVALGVKLVAIKPPATNNFGMRKGNKIQIMVGFQRFHF